MFHDFWRLHYKNLQKNRLFALPCLYVCVCTLMRLLRASPPLKMLISAEKKVSNESSPCIGQSKYIWGVEEYVLPDRPCGPPNFLYNGYRVFPGDKSAGAWRWPPTPIKRRDEGENITSNPPLGLRGLL